MFIHDFNAISAQLTYDNRLLDGEVLCPEDGAFKLQEPNLMEVVPRSLLRRMGKAIRIGIGGGLNLIKQHPDVDGILIGTANGGLEDCIQFLNQIVDYDEGMLTPTNFVASTPNAVAGQLALMGQVRKYNITYTHGGTSFESALIDAQLLLNEGNGNKLLIGGVEEISTYNYNIDLLNDLYKENWDGKDLLESTTKGTICGEGAGFFVCSNENKGAIGEIVDVFQFSGISIDQLKEQLSFFLEQNGVSINDLNSLMLGYNGDVRHNTWYDAVCEFASRSDVLGFKHLIGDFRNVSSVGLWMLLHIMNGNSTLVNECRQKTGTQSNSKYYLLYNNFNCNEHGLILLRKV